MKKQPEFIVEYWSGKIIRVVVLGESESGKTELIRSCLSGVTLLDEYISTIGDSYDFLYARDASSRDLIRIMDTPPLNDPEVVSAFIPYADAFIIIFNYCNSKAFDDIKKIKSEINRIKGKEVIFGLIITNYMGESVSGENLSEEFIRAWCDQEKAFGCYFIRDSDDSTLYKCMSKISLRIHSPSAEKRTGFFRKFK